MFKKLLLLKLKKKKLNIQSEFITVIKQQVYVVKLKNNKINYIFIKISRLKKTELIVFNKNFCQCLEKKYNYTLI